MTRFAIIPLAIFANACADSAGLDNIEDTEAEVRDLIEDYGVEEDRNASHIRTLGLNLVRLANTKYADSLQGSDCSVVGGAFGQWDNQSGEFRGMTFHNSAQVMATFSGHTKNQANFGIVHAENNWEVENSPKLILEGDWGQGDFVGDVYSADPRNSTEYTIFAVVEESKTTGQFFGALTICNN